MKWEHNVEAIFEDFVLVFLTKNYSNDFDGNSYYGLECKCFD
jgi:hypothetical protein